MPDTTPLVLASGSPRRRDLLGAAGIAFEIRPADVDESALPGEKPLEHAVRLARAKALAVAGRPDAGGRVVLGADTIVVLDDRVYGKPRDAAEAVSHLSALCGRTHRVITAVAVVRGDEVREVAVESRVTLRDAPPDEIRAYAASGEPLDKAGAYALQGEGGRLVAAVEGSRTNVIGLPMDETLELLAHFGVTAP
ncbi:MAG: Maf family protein [Myxococcota bacterium]